MKPAAWVLLALVLSALQSALLAAVGGGTFTVLLLAPCLVYLGFHAGNVDGVVAAAGVGYVLDLTTGSPKGLMTFLAVGVFLLARALVAGVDVRGWGGFAVASVAAALFLSLGALALAGFVAPADASPGAGLLPRMLVEALLTGALSPLVLLGMRRVDGLFTREEPGLLR